jgi:NAD(P)H-flavin reductase
MELATCKEEVSIYMEGPYGSLAVDIEDDGRYKVTVLVSGGIGVTHCQSIGKALIHQHFQRGRQLKLLKFVCTLPDIGMAKDISPLGGPVNEDTEHVVETDVYCTRNSKKKSEEEDGEEGPLVDDEPYYHIYPNHPDWDFILEEVKREALDLGETHIAVYGCGPPSKMDDLREVCRKHSHSFVGCL